jgi:F0F1-type ATP synthase alpha subunit
MTNNASWLENAVNRVATAQLGPVIEDFGRVETIGDGIAMISGLPSVRLDEVLRFQRGQLGFAQTLDTDLIGCVLLDDAEAVEAGDTVHGTGAVIRTPVGPAFLAASSIRSGARLMAASRSTPPRTTRSRPPRRLSSSANWSPSRSRPAS